MTNVIPMAMAYLMVTQTRAQNLLDTLGKAVIKEGAAVQHSVAEIAAYVVSKECEGVKKIIGVDYEQMSDPDLSQLTLDYISSEVNVTYNLTTAAQTITAEPWYSPKNNFTIFIHGFTSSPYKAAFEAIRNAFVAIGRHVLALDCSAYISSIYLRATTYVSYIGEKLAGVLATFVKLGMDPSTIYLIGHSLGAHACSFTGKSFFNITGKKLGRISGLDAAGPCMSVLDESQRLSATDATFVDAIHTNGGAYGLKRPCGQVDFFPNGGSLQPNCVSQLCEHNRVWELYSESVVKPETFIGVQCDNYEQFRRGQCSNKRSVMGYACPPGTRGLFYLQTAGQSPYGFGANGTKYTNNEGIVNNIVVGVENILG